MSALAPCPVTEFMADVLRSLPSGPGYVRIDLIGYISTLELWRRFALRFGIQRTSWGDVLPCHVPAADAALATLRGRLAAAEAELAGAA
jgi:hypothetical protein